MRRMQIFLMAAYFAGAMTSTWAARAFPDQPVRSGSEVINYGNEIPSRATFPARGATKYEFARNHVLICMKRTYVLEAQDLLKNPDHDASYLLHVMREGQCSFSSPGDKPFRVVRFESYDAQIGHADLAYAAVSFSDKEVGAKGQGFSFPFYVDRRDIVRAK